VLPTACYVQPPISTNPPKTDESQLTLKRSYFNGFRNINTEDIRVRPAIYGAFVELTLKDLGEPLIALFYVDETNLELSACHYEYWS
jgi:hypothetical protein